MKCVLVPAMLAANAALLLTLLVGGGCRSPEPTTDPSIVDTTRTDRPVTYEEIERALVGRWRVKTSFAEAGSFYTAREMIFGPNRVWVSPSFRDYGGRYTVVGDTLRLHHDPTDTEVVWRFTLVGDVLTLSDDVQTAEYERVRVPFAPP